MKNRKLYQLFIASVISATMMTSGISVSASDFSDDTSAQEQILDNAKEEEAPAVDDGISGRRSQSSRSCSQQY